MMMKYYKDILLGGQMNTNSDIIIIFFFPAYTMWDKLHGNFFY